MWAGVGVIFVVALVAAGAYGLTGNGMAVSLGAAGGLSLGAVGWFISKRIAVQRSASSESPDSPQHGGLFGMWAAGFAVRLILLFMLGLGFAYVLGPDLNVALLTLLGIYLVLLTAEVTWIYRLLMQDKTRE